VNNPILLPLILLAAACAKDTAGEVSFPTLAVQSAKHELRAGDQIELDVWIEYHGELELYNSRKARDLNLVFPYCISAGLGPNLSNIDASDLDNKRASVRGTLLKYESPKDEPYTISTSTVIDGMFFKNWCFSPYVLRIEELTLR